MKWIACLILSLAACGLVFLGLADDQPMLAPSPSPTGPAGEPSLCLSEATIQVTATPSKIDLGQSTIVSWSVGLPNVCNLVRVRLNDEPVATSGSRSVCPGRSTTFTVLVSETRSGVYGEKSKSTLVEVKYPPRVVIDSNTCDPVGVLVGALGESNENDEQTVELSCGVVLDLTGESVNITRDKRSLIASPNCARGPRTRNEDVPLIRTGNAPASRAAPAGPRREPLFSIHSDHVLFSGFRLEGPTSGIGEDPYLEVGISVLPSRCDPTPSNNCIIRHIEFSNMEIYWWSGSGIGLTDNVQTQERGRLVNTYSVFSPERPAPSTVLTEEGGTRPRVWHPDQDVVGAVHIKGNYFHDNRHAHGFGYGVTVGGGAYALIEQNVFNNNRHAIAGDSKNPGGPDFNGDGKPDIDHVGLDYSGYTARDNLIGPEGGSHCNPDHCNWVIGGGSILTVVNGSNPVLAGLGILGFLGGLACHAFDLECAHTHQIDMHGDKNEWGSGSNWNCGTAGETIIIERNTILYTGGNTLVDVVRDIFGSRGYAIKIRGDPADRAVVDSNVFKHGNREEAISQNDNCHGKKTHPIKEVNNIFDRDPLWELASYIFGRDPSLKELASCDFSGFRNGQKDQFMVTGVTWWALSPVSTQFHYLNTMAEPADDLAKGQQLSDLKLADLDGDGVCDVAPNTARPFPRRLYSKSGRSPWIPLPLDMP